AGLRRRGRFRGRLRLVLPVLFGEMLGAQPPSPTRFAAPFGVAGVVARLGKLFLAPLTVMPGAISLRFNVLFAPFSLASPFVRHSHFLPSMVPEPVSLTHPPERPDRERPRRPDAERSSTPEFRFCLAAHQVQQHLASRFILMEHQADLLRNGHL